jgi:hypothetical protein
MAWIVPQYSRQRVNEAGNALVEDTLWLCERDIELSIINNWRSSHSYPLHVIKMNLLQRARKVDPNAIIAQRQKRLSSIKAKLLSRTDMKLSQMQDLGGCRAVMIDMNHVTKLVNIYREASSRNPKRHLLAKEKDYIASPKTDGYRSFHFVYKYKTETEKYKVFNDQKIEIQIRSRLQHAWATAVETISTFTGQALKSSIGHDIGHEDWLRFFALMSSAIASREKCAPVPGTPEDKQELKRELRELSSSLKVQEVLQGWGTAVQHVMANSTNAHAFLLVLNPNKNILNVTPYLKNQLNQANDEYLIAERRTETDPSTQAVLVSVDSIATLKSAFPNYYLDTTAFVKALIEATK